MVDHDDSKELIGLAQQNINNALEYSKARNRYSKAKLYIDLRLAEALPELRKKRSNIGYDMAVLMLLEKSPELESYYEEFIRQQNLYKGLEKIMNAVSSRISLGQSLIKNKIQEGI